MDGILRLFFGGHSRVGGGGIFDTDSSIDLVGLGRVLSSAGEETDWQRFILHMGMSRWYVCPAKREW